MKEYKISRLYLENYKLFDKKEFLFNGCSISVFDGPNGYGKTSIFDAIEFLITGSIKRIFESTSILKNEAYDNVFIAGNPRKDIIIKGEFVSSENEQLIIAKVIPGVKKFKKGKKNNPTKLGELVENYILPSYDSSDFKAEYKCDNSDIVNMFGSEILDFYHLFYYIKQEDRLDFLKKTEKDRMSGINKLFNIEKEQLELNITNKILRNLNKAFTDLQQSINLEEKELEALKIELDKFNSKDTKYEKLMYWKKDTEIWDKEVIEIGDLNKVENIVNKVKSIKYFIAHFNNFKIGIKNNWCNRWNNQQELITYFLELYPFKDYLSEAKVQYNILKFLKEQVNLFDNEQYTKINYKKIMESIEECKINIELIEEILKQIENCDRNSNEISKAYGELNQAREILQSRASRVNIESENGQCVFCGYDWGNKNELVTQINRTTQFFKSFNDNNINLKESKIRELKAICEEQIIPYIQSKLEANANLDKAVFEQLIKTNSIVEESFNEFLKGCKQFNIDIETFVSDFNKSQQKESIVLALRDYILSLCASLDKDYLELSLKHDFNSIYNLYFNSNDENVKSLTEDRIDKKIKYIELNYYNSTFDKIKNKNTNIQELTKRINILNNEIIPKVTEYRDAIKNSIETYQNRIIKNIEIPFYIYSGRIMQSYQGGLGILIKEPDKSEDGLNSIRFISPTRSGHDIIYTLSSGQLSAAIISFTLALNKVYCNNKLNCIFIDDPVQTMDELNIASFVEVIRNEFQDRQVILSTHEDSFSRYIRYKYSKYGLKANSITLKNNE